jgi:hypothetical protein
MCFDAGNEGGGFRKLANRGIIGFFCLKFGSLGQRQIYYLSAMLKYEYAMLYEIKRHNFISSVLHPDIQKFGGAA